MAQQAEIEASDLDLLVDALPGASLLDVCELQVELEDLLGVRVDVLTLGDLPARFREQVLAEAQKPGARPHISSKGLVVTFSSLQKPNGGRPVHEPIRWKKHSRDEIDAPTTQLDARLAVASAAAWARRRWSVGRRRQPLDEIAALG